MEVGALRTRYPIDAMQSSQMSMVNRTGILISTAYESLNNPMTQEMEYAMKVLDGVIEDDELFALLYKPDNADDWLSDTSMLEANPLALDINDNFEYLKKQRQQAIEMPEAQRNFKTKHMNIFVDGDDGEIYIPVDKLKPCMIKEYDWNGRDVYIGVDLAQTSDNTAVTMVAYDEEINKFVAQSFAFIPTDNVINKERLEKVPYTDYIKKEWCYSCGDTVVDYAFIQDFLINLQDRFGVNILNVGYDRFNCIASANYWYAKGLEVTEIKQHSSVLHSPTKFLKECVLTGMFAYVENSLLEVNFSNCKMVLDTNLNGYVNKKKSTGKIDMVASMINAMVFWNQDFSGAVNVYESDDREYGFISL